MPPTGAVFAGETAQIVDVLAPAFTSISFLPKNTYLDTDQMLKDRALYQALRSIYGDLCFGKLQMQNVVDQVMDRNGLRVEDRKLFVECKSKRLRKGCQKIQKAPPGKEPWTKKVAFWLWGARIIPTWQVLESPKKPRGWCTSACTARVKMLRALPHLLQRMYKDLRCR